MAEITECGEEEGTYRMFGCDCEVSVGRHKEDQILLSEHESGNSYSFISSVLLDLSPNVDAG